MEPRIRELREDFALRKIPTASFEANALYLAHVCAFSGRGHPQLIENTVSAPRLDAKCSDNLVPY